jgi:hypothetical protein
MWLVTVYVSTLIMRTISNNGLTVFTNSECPRSVIPAKIRGSELRVILLTAAARTLKTYETKQSLSIKHTYNDCRRAAENTVMGLMRTLKDLAS